MIIHPAQQHSLEWLTARAGVITASEINNILTPTFKARDGEMRHTYMCKKLAEKWTGSPLPGFSSIDAEFGNILEDEGIPCFSLETGLDVERVGLCLRDDGRVAASPDGLIGEDGGIELKAPRQETHIKYLLAGGVPKDYIVQVHSALYVTGRPWWKFVSYARRLPLLIVTVERDEEIIQKIEDALEPFLSDFDAAYTRLCEINGGPPRRAVPKPTPTPYVSDPNDLMP